MNRLNAFEKFEKDVILMFQLDRHEFKDKTGSYTEAIEKLIAAMNESCSLLEKSDLNGLSKLLTESLPRSLSRMKSFIPVLKKHIDKVYITNDAK